MELVHSIILLITLFIRDVENVLLKRENIKALKDEKVLLVSEEPSLLQCAQRCRFIDKNSIVDFKNSKCTCMKYELDEEQELNGTLTGVFVNQKLMKMKPPQSIKPRKTRVMNVALNKTANQSTVDDPARIDSSFAKFAIDGLMSTGMSTKKEVNQWFSVDLNSITDIIYMVFYGYMKDDNSRALNVETRQKEDDTWITCKNIGDVNSSPLNFTCDNPTNARYVKISSTERCFIHIYEFEVYARVAA